MSLARRTAFLIRVTWNHSILGYLVREFAFVLRSGAWTLCVFSFLVGLLARVPDPLDATHPGLAAIGRVGVAAVATAALWAIVGLISDAKRYRFHLPRVDD